MGDSQQSFVLVLGVQLHQVVAGEVVLHEFAEVVLVAGGRCDEQLSEGELRWRWRCSWWGWPAV